MWNCDDGPNPGQPWDLFNILTESGYELPEGNWEFKLISFDHQGFSSVSIDAASGDVDVVMTNTYIKRKYYKINYKIVEIDGTRSSSGCIEICTKNQCLDCEGECDPLTADCLVGHDVYIDAECNYTNTVDVSSWDYDNWVINSSNGCVANVLLSANVLTFDTVGCQPGANSFELSLYRGCLVKNVTINFEIKDKCIHVPQGYVCDSCSGAMIKTEGGDYDAPGSHPVYTEVIGCDDAEVYTVLTADETLVSNVVVTSSGITYDIVCSDQLPTTTKVVYEVSACGASTTGFYNLNLDLCANSNCGPNEVCNPCTGLCEEVCPVVTVGVKPVISSGVLNDTFQGVTNTADCPTKMPPVVITPPNPISPVTIGVSEEVCNTEGGLNPCDNVVLPDDCPCWECKVENGKPVLYKAEEVWDDSILDEVCEGDLFTIFGTCGTPKQGFGRRAEVWDESCLDDICCEDTVTLIGTCNTSKVYKGRKTEVWDTGDLSKVCGAKEYTSNCGNIKIFNGTMVEVWDTSNIDLTKLCDNDTVCVFGSCGTPKEFRGEKPCFTAEI